MGLHVKASGHGEKDAETAWKGQPPGKRVGRRTAHFHDLPFMGWESLWERNDYAFLSERAENGGHILTIGCVCVCLTGTRRAPLVCRYSPGVLSPEAQLKALLILISPWMCTGSPKASFRHCFPLILPCQISLFVIRNTHDPAEFEGVSHVGQAPREASNVATVWAVRWTGHTAGSRLPSLGAVFVRIRVLIREFQGRRGSPHR